MCFEAACQMSVYRVPAAWGSTFGLGITGRKAVKSFPIDNHRGPHCVLMAPAKDSLKRQKQFCQMILNLQGLVWVVKGDPYWNHSGAFPPWKMYPTSAKFRQGHRSDHPPGEGYRNITRLLPQAARLAQLGWNKIQIPTVPSQIC